MADNRGMQYPGHRPPGTAPNYGMMPNMSQQFVSPGMAPGVYPMMQQQMMTQPVMRQMFPMQQQMAMRGVAPPPYTPQMAQNFRLRSSVPSRPQKELSEKEKQFQLQQQRLKQFGKPGAITADADRLIANIFGPNKPQTRMPPKSQGPAQGRDDDTFGDFMQGPSTDGGPAQPHSIQLGPSLVTPEMIGANRASQNSSPGMSSDTNQMPQPQPVQKHKEEKKGPDLMAMMMECSDLNAPQKAKAFHKPSLKEVQVEHHISAPVFHQSDHARKWWRQDDLDGVFATEPPPVPVVVKTTKRRHSSGTGKPVVAKTAAGLPVWCEATEDQAPPLYKHVLEASYVDGKINTDRVYPILMMSGLPRETLGTLWQLANKETPGQLTRSELFAILALIALTQNNYTVTTIDILLRCPHPPVPFLGPQSVAIATPSSAGPATLHESQSVGPADGSQQGFPVSNVPPGAPPNVIPQGAVPPQGPLYQSPPHSINNQTIPPHSTPLAPPTLPMVQAPPPYLSGQAPPLYPGVPPTTPYPSGQVPPGHPNGQVALAYPSGHTPPPPISGQVPSPFPVNQSNHPHPPNPQAPPYQASPGFAMPPSQGAPTTTDDDFADFQIAPPANAVTNDDDGFGDFIGGTSVASKPAAESNKQPYVMAIPKVEPELEVASPDDKYNSNVRSFFCSSDSSTAETPKHESNPKGHTTPSLDDEDFTDCRDSSQMSTSEQSESEDIKAFESYVEEFHRKKEEREKENPEHRHLSQSTRVVQPLPKIPSVPKSVPSIPPAPQSPRPLGSDDFSEFKSAVSGSSLFKPPPKNVYASQAQQAKQTVLKAAQKLALENDDFTDFQEAPTPTGKPPAEKSEDDLMGEEDKYNALRVFCSDSVPVPSVFEKPAEQEEFADFDNQEEDWSGFAEAEGEPPAEQKQEEAKTVQDHSAILSLYGKGQENEEEEDDWADFAGPSEQASDKASEVSLSWPALPGSASDSSQGERTPVNPVGETEGFGSSGFGMSSAFAKSDDSLNNSGWGGFTQSNIPSNSSIVNSQTESDWSDFHASNTAQDAGILKVKKSNLGSSEVLGVFKVKDNPSSSSYKLPPKSSVRLPSQESDIDDDRIPPPMDTIEDDDDHDHFSRGYDLDDMVRHTAVTTGYSVFGMASHHFSSSKHKAETKTVDSLRSSEERAQSMSPDIQLAETDSSSSKDMDSYGWKDKNLGIREDSQSVSSLEFPKGQASQKDSDNGGDSQSVSSVEFGNFEASSRTPASAESKSLDSLDLYKKEADLDGEQQTEENNAGIVPAAVAVPGFGGEMRALADRYNIDGEVQCSNSHEHEWERCIDNCCRMIKDANTTFNSVSGSSVCNEIMRSSQGSEYVAGIIEIYKVSCRILAAMTAAGIKTAALERMLKEIDLAWNNLTAFFVGASILPEPTALNFFHAVIKSDTETAQQKACGVCLLDVDAKSKSFKQDEDTTKLTYGGRQYHAPCANFWINCVDSTLPALRLPELL